MMLSLVAAALVVSQVPDAPATSRVPCGFAYRVCYEHMLRKQPEQAQVCLQNYLARCPDHEDKASAQALLQLATEMQKRGPQKRSPQPKTGDSSSTAHAKTARSQDLVTKTATKTVSVTDIINSGTPEFVLISTAYGAGAGFLSAATMASGLRLPSPESLTLVTTLPVLGAVTGFAAASASAWLLAPSSGDMALLSSAMTVGTAYGIALQLFFSTLFGVSELPAHVETSVRFASVLATSALCTSAAAAIAPFVDVDAGDVGLMNSAALWGAVLTFLSSAQFLGNFGSNNGLATTVLAGSVLAYDAVFLLSPWLDVVRPTTLLIEVGGATGLLFGFAMMIGNSSFSAPGPIVLAPTTLLGVAAGTAASFLLSPLVRQHAPSVAALQLPNIQPLLMQDSQNPDRPPVVGLALAGTW